MTNTNVCIYANEVEGPFSDDTARLRVVGQFSLPATGIPGFHTVEYVVGQINNRSTAKFVAPVREALAKMGRDGMRAGDVIQLNTEYSCYGYSLVNDSGTRTQEEYSGEIERSVV